MSDANKNILSEAEMASKKAANRPKDQLDIINSKKFKGSGKRKALIPKNSFFLLLLKCFGLSLFDEYGNKRIEKTVSLAKIDN